MPAVRRRFRIVLDGEEPIELTTNALDLIRAERDGQGSVAQGMRTAHNAALRLRKPVPVKFEAFAEALVEWDDITDDAPDLDGSSETDPTQSAGSELSP